MLLFSGGFLLASLRYPIGTARQMGPAYFPMVVAGFGLIIAVLLFIRAVRVPQTGGELVSWRPMISVFAAIAVFALGLATLGLLPAVAATIIVSALADRHSRPLETALLAIGFSIASWLIFSVLLRLPFPLFRMPF